MSFAADRFPAYNGPGVYLIRCARDGKVYVGRSIVVRQRLRGHRCLLLQQKHRNRHLQFAWNKHGEGVFEFLLLEACVPERLRERETYWVQKHKALDDRCGYNFVDPVDSVGRQREFIVTDPEGNERRISNLNKFCRENGLIDSHMTRVAQGTSLQSRGWLCRYADETLYDWLEKRDEFSKRSARTRSYRGEYLVTTPKFREYRVSRLPAFCVAHRLSYACMINVAAGGQRRYKGWMCERTGELSELELERCRLRQTA